MSSRLALGTAQFGLSYGVANVRGQVPPDEIARILSVARTRGVNTLDTAVGYGESEKRIGQARVGGFKIITKIPKIPHDVPDVCEFVVGQIRASLTRLQRKSIAGALLHAPDQLLQSRGDEIFAAMQHIRRQGLAKKIGYSIYAPEELDQLVDRFPPELVQAPFNIIDRRLETSGWMKRLHAGGAEIHTRSAFLQGLLLMEPAQRPAYFDKWASLLDRWTDFTRTHGCTELEGALQFVLGYVEIDKVVVGVDSERQLDEILAARAANAEPPPPTLACSDRDLVEPSRWNLR